MKDLEMFPIQFIEGFNENEEPSGKPFPTFQESSLAIPYIPNMTYGLTVVEIYGSLKESVKGRLQIYTDHEDRPGKVLLAEATMMDSGSGEQWQRFELTSSVVVMPHHRYWLAVERPLNFAFGHADSGKDVSPMGMVQGKWHRHQSGGVWKFMLRFYGRVLPVATG